MKRPSMCSMQAKWEMYQRRIYFSSTVFATATKKEPGLYPHPCSRLWQCSVTTHFWHRCSRNISSYEIVCCLWKPTQSFVRLRNENRGFGSTQEGHSRMKIEHLAGLRRAFPQWLMDVQLPSFIRSDGASSAASHGIGPRHARVLVQGYHLRFHYSRAQKKKKK